MNLSRYVFSRVFNQRISEAVSYEYKVPSGTNREDKKKAFFDFYTWTLIDGTKEKPVTFQSPSTKADLDVISKEAVGKIVDFMSTKVEDAASVGIIRELRHLSDTIYVPSNTIREQYLEDGLGITSEQAEYLLNQYREDTDSIRGGRPEENFTSDKIRKLEDTIGKHFGSFDKFVKVAIDAYGKLSWKVSYGGLAWHRIAKGLQRLRAAKSIQDKIIMTDNVLSLQHNTGNALNKHPYFQEPIKVWQDLKFAATHPSQVAEYSSIPKYVLGMYSAYKAGLGGLATLPDTRGKFHAQTKALSGIQVSPKVHKGAGAMVAALKGKFGIDSPSAPLNPFQDDALTFDLDSMIKVTNKGPYDLFGEQLYPDFAKSSSPPIALPPEGLTAYTFADIVTRLQGNILPGYNIADYMKVLEFLGNLESIFFVKDNKGVVIMCGTTKKPMTLKYTPIGAPTSYASYPSGSHILIRSLLTGNQSMTEIFRKAKDVFSKTIHVGDEPKAKFDLLKVYSSIFVPLIEPILKSTAGNPPILGKFKVDLFKRPWFYFKHYPPHLFISRLLKIVYKNRSSDDAVAYGDYIEAASNTELKSFFLNKVSRITVAETPKSLLVLGDVMLPFTWDAAKAVKPGLFPDGIAQRARTDYMFLLAMVDKSKVNKSAQELYDILKDKLKEEKQ